MSAHVSVKYTGSDWFALDAATKRDIEHLLMKMRFLVACGVHATADQLLAVEMELTATLVASRVICGDEEPTPGTTIEAWTDPTTGDACVSATAHYGM